MIFIKPKFNQKEKLIGVYKISFDNKWIYVGSSTNIRSRYLYWQCVFSNKNSKTPINIKSILSEILEVKFEVIKLCNDVINLRKMETDYIKTYWDSPLLLNRCPDGSTFKGKRPFTGYVKPKKEVGIKSPPQKIAQFDLDWNFLKVYPSKGALMKDFKNCTHNKVNKHLKGENTSVCGFKFKLVSDNGSFVDHASFISKRGTIKDKKTREKFYQVDIKGCIVGEFYNCGTVARLLNVGRSGSSHISEILRKTGKQKSFRGYTFVYADEYDKNFNS